MARADVVPPPGPVHPSEQDFSRGLKWSLVLHLGIAIVILLKSLVFPDKPMFFAPTLRVDIVGLPDILKKDLANAGKLQAQSKSLEEALKKAEAEAEKIKSQPVPKTKIKESEPAKPDELVYKPKAMDAKARQKHLQSSLARIKALAKISGESADSKSGQIIKGNKISKGTSLAGDARESAAASYYDVLRDRLQENWALPKWIARQNLSATVQVFIDNRGQMRSFRFVKLSNNGQFDEAVKRTLMESQPFPVPPPELANALLTDGISVGFPL